MNPTVHLLDLENSVRSGYTEVLNQEETLWATKSRSNWIRHGDIHTKKKPEWKWDIWKETTLKSGSSKTRVKTGYMILTRRKIFSKISSKICFTVKDLVLTNPVLEFNPPSVLKVSMVNSIMRDVSESEILFTHNSLSPLKSPGPHGLHPIFYQKNWILLGVRFLIVLKKSF